MSQDQASRRINPSPGARSFAGDNIEIASPVGYLDGPAWDRLARPRDDADFYGSWLALQCRTTPHVTTGVIVLGEPQAGKYMPVAHWPENGRPHPLVAKAAELVLERGQGIVLRDSVNGEGGAAVVAYPVFVDERLHGLCAVGVAGAGDLELQVVMRQLQWGSPWLERWIRRRDESEDRQSIGRLKLALDATACTLDHKGFEAAALSTVTEVGARLGSSRVALGLRRGSRASRVMAISGSATLVRRSVDAKALAAVMDEAIDQQVAIVHPPPASNDLIVTRAHAELAQSSSPPVAQIITVPFTGQDGLAGALVFEFADPGAKAAQRLDIAKCVSGLSGPLLARLHDEDQPLALKAVHAARQSVVRLTAPDGAVPRLVLAGLIGLIAFLSLFSITFRVTADARLEGMVQRTAAAPFAGFLSYSATRPGDVVEAGAVLARLDDRDLELERHAWMMRREQYQKEQQRVLSEHKASAVKVLEAQADEAAAQAALLSDKIERTKIRAPIAGLVIEGDHSQSLGRAVQQGESLFTIAPLASYRVVIEVEESDVVHIEAGQSGSLLLTGLPMSAIPFKVTRVTPTTISSKGRNAFRVEAELLDTPQALRPGMEGIAKIEAGRNLLVWIWSRRLLDWARLQIWSWWP
jgi:multidrug resistance efflux pump